MTVRRQGRCAVTAVLKNTPGTRKKQLLQPGLTGLETDSETKA